MTALTPPPSTIAVVPAPLLKGLFGEFFALSKPVKTLRDINFEASPKVEGMVRSIDLLETGKSFFRGLRRTPLRRALHGRSEHLQGGNTPSSSLRIMTRRFVLHPRAGDPDQCR